MSTTGPRPVVVDTNIISFMFRGDTRAGRYAQLLGQLSPYLSVVSIAELLYGAQVANWSRRRTSDLMSVTQSYVVVDITPQVAEAWAGIRAQSRRTGRTIPYSDLWIGATALVMDCPVVTHNPRDFQSIAGLEVVTYA